MAASFVLKNIVPVALVLFAEHFHLPNKLPALYEPSSKLAFLPKGFAAVLVVNVIVTAGMLIYLGLKVASARTVYKLKAEKDGDKDAEARYSYPKMYAEGFTVTAKHFNCVQRGHQQALETYTQFVALSLVGGLYYPVTVTLAGLLWNYARIKWAEGYATGEPGNRYNSWVSRGIWTSLIMVFLASIGSAYQIAL